MLSISFLLIIFGMKSLNKKNSVPYTLWHSIYLLLIFYLLSNALCLLQETETDSNPILANFFCVSNSSFFEKGNTMNIFFCHFTTKQFTEFQIGYLPSPIDTISIPISKNSFVKKDGPNPPATIGTL